ncbi:glutamate receptor ionotropic, delta-1 [Procambarus clarkii]|uniref:glutamate receptor ionotropic, delta-1 n=1 Tax=Procambarus clarkii TaxID=6728 RepID=UPI00374411F7
MYQCAGSEEVGDLYRARAYVRDKMLTVVTIHRPPFVFLEVNSTGHILHRAGFAFDMLEELQRKLGFRYRLVLPCDGNWGNKLPNGSWDGMVGMVIRKEADLGVAPFTITLERAQVIEFTFPYHVEPSAILTPAVRQSRKITAFLDPFHYQVWLAIAATLVILGPVMHTLAGVPWLAFLYPHTQVLNCGPVTLLGHYWMLSAALLQQGVVYPMNAASRVVFGAWITGVIALSCAYTGVLISFLSVPKTEKLIQSLHDLPSQEELKWTFARGSAHEALFLDKEADGIYAKIGSPFRSDHSGLASSNAQAVAMVLRGTHVYIKERSYLDFAIEEDYHRSGKCNLDIAPVEFFPAGFGWIHRKNDTIGQLFNREFIKMQQTGLFRKWKLKYWPKPNECTGRGRRSNSKALDVSDMLGSFTVLAFGFLCALIILLLELYRKKVRLRSRATTNTKRTQSLHRSTILQEQLSSQKSTYGLLSAIPGIHAIPVPSVKLIPPTPVHHHTSPSPDSHLSTIVALGDQENTRSQLSPRILGPLKHPPTSEQHCYLGCSSHPDTQSHPSTSALQHPHTPVHQPTHTRSHTVYLSL